MASQNLVVAVGYKNKSGKKVTAPQMGEHQMPPAQRLRPREKERPEKANMSCKAQLPLKDSAFGQKNERSVETQGPHYYYCCYDTPNVSVTHSKTMVGYT